MENNNARGTDSQQDAIVSTLPIEKIVQLMDENTDRHFGLKCEPFARAVEIETIRRFRAQGGITNTESSDLAPTTSTVSAPEEVRNAVLEEAAKVAEAQNRVGYEWVKDSVWDNIIKRVPAAIRALKRTTSGKGEAA